LNSWFPLLPMTPSTPLIFTIITSAYSPFGCEPPLNVPFWPPPIFSHSQRTDNPDVVFRLEQYKWRAVVTEIKRMNKSGRPCLVGTTSVEKSEMLSSLLQAEGIKHQV